MDRLQGHRGPEGLHQRDRQDHPGAHHRHHGAATSASCRMRSSARASSRCCPTPTCTEEVAMQVILMEKVANLGDLGDVVKVKDGFARNFLIPHGKAKRATEANLQGVRGAPRRAGEGADRARSTKAQERGDEARGPEAADQRRRPGVDGRLFGSVTNYDIVEALEEAGPRGRARADPHAAGPAQAGRRLPASQVALHTDVAVDHQGLGARRAVSRRIGAEEPVRALCFLSAALKRRIFTSSLTASQLPQLRRRLQRLSFRAFLTGALWQRVNRRLRELSSLSPLM